MEISYIIHLVKNDLRDPALKRWSFEEKKRKIVKYFLFGSQILNFESALVSKILEILFDDVNVSNKEQSILSQIFSYFESPF
jgi:hypothetical protein